MIIYSPDLRYIASLVTQTDPSTGNAIDPTTSTLSFAFKFPGAQPIAADFSSAGSWVATPQGYIAQCLVGANTTGGAINLTSGSWDVYFRVANLGFTVEEPVFYLGTLEVK